MLDAAYRLARPDTVGVVGKSYTAARVAGVACDRSKLSMPVRSFPPFPLRSESDLRGKDLPDHAYFSSGSGANVTPIATIMILFLYELNLSRKIGL